jgi:hypothetical protein
MSKSNGLERALAMIGTFELGAAICAVHNCLYRRHQQQRQENFAVQ